MGNVKQNKTYSKKVEEIVENLSLMDDDLMWRVFDENIPATQLLLRTILGRELEVIFTKGQWETENPLVTGRCIRLDVFARDIDGDYFDCEVQRSDAGAIPKRARFHSAMMDARMLNSGEDFQKLRDSYVIFITENDYYHEGKALYQIERKRENGECFEDGNHIIYVNGRYDGDDDLGQMLADFRRTETTGFNFPELEKGVRHFKVDKEGKSTMCEAVEKYGIEKRNEGRTEGKIESIRALMKNLKMTAEQAMESVGISQSEYDKYLKLLKG